MKRPIGVIGFGGHAREVSSYSEDRIVFYAVNTEYLKDDLIDIQHPPNELLSVPVVAAIGSPYHRKQMVGYWPGENYANVLATNSTIKSKINGSGLQIAPNAIIMTDCSLGDHIVINTGATLGHNCTVGDYATISPGVNIGGYVDIGEGAFIGIGATIKNNITIAKGAVIGAGAVVVKDASVENGVYVGNPARLLKTNESWLDEV